MVSRMFFLGILKPVLSMAFRYASQRFSPKQATSPVLVISTPSTTSAPARREKENWGTWGGAGLRDRPHAAPSPGPGPAHLDANDARACHEPHRLHVLAHDHLAGQSHQVYPQGLGDEGEGAGHAHVALDHLQLVVLRRGDGCEGRPGATGVLAAPLPGTAPSEVPWQ